MTRRPILIVDDDAAVRNIVRQVLTLEGYAVLEAATGREGVHAWEQHAPQLIILDIIMPQMSGLQVLEHIRQNSDTPIVMLTRKTSEDDKVHAFELGADDYLSKPFSSRELLVRVKAVLRRTQGPRSSTSSTKLIAGAIHLDLDTRRVSIGGRVVSLSRTEFQLLTELARTPGRVLSREHLLRTLWGAEHGDDGRILHCAIYRLRLKLEPDISQPIYLLGARDVGYWLAAPEAVDA